MKILYKKFLCSMMVVEIGSSVHSLWHLPDDGTFKLVLRENMIFRENLKLLEDQRDKLLSQRIVLGEKKEHLNRESTEIEKSLRMCHGKIAECTRNKVSHSEISKLEEESKWSMENARLRKFLHSSYEDNEQKLCMLNSLLKHTQKFVRKLTESGNEDNSMDRFIVEKLEEKLKDQSALRERLDELYDEQRKFIRMNEGLKKRVISLRSQVSKASTVNQGSSESGCNSHEKEGSKGVVTEGESFDANISSSPESGSSPSDVEIERPKGELKKRHGSKLGQLTGVNTLTRRVKKHSQLESIAEGEEVVNKLTTLLQSSESNVESLKVKFEEQKDEYVTERDMYCKQVEVLQSAVESLLSMDSNTENSASLEDNGIEKSVLDVDDPRDSIQQKGMSAGEIQADFGKETAKTGDNKSEVGNEITEPEEQIVPENKKLRDLLNCVRKFKGLVISDEED